MDTKEPVAAAALVGTDELSEEIFQQFKSDVEDVKIEYSQRYEKLAHNLCASHLELFFKIIETHEGITLCDKDDLVQMLKKKTVDELQRGADHLWNSMGVENSLLTLGTLKAKFSQMEGIDWKLDEQTPSKRLLPLRMRFKQAHARTLQRLLERQKVELEELVKETVQNRETLREMSQQHEFQKRTIQQCKQHFQQSAHEIATMQEELLAIDSGGSDME